MIRATHAPAPGRYAHLASTGLTDHVVLDSHNGRPTLLILEIDATPVLAWMVLGHGDDAELWIYLPLTDDEAAGLTEHPPMRLTEWLAHRVGRDAFLGLAEEGVLAFTTGWQVPDVPAQRLPASAANAAVDDLLRTVQTAEALSAESRRALDNSRPRFRELADAC